LGWAIAEANPDIANSLILDAGISLALPELRSLRRPLTAANPAREDDGEFQQLPPQAPSPIVPPSGGSGAVVFPISVAQGGSGVDNAVAALEVFGGISKNTKGLPNGVAPLDGAALVPFLNLPPYPTLASLGGIATSAIGTTIAPLINGLVPVNNLPPYPTLASLGAVSSSVFTSTINQLIPLTAIGAANGVAPLGANSLVPSQFLPTYPTLASLGGIPLAQKGAVNGVAPLDSNGLVPFLNLPSYPTLNSLGALAASSRGAASGVAPLDANSLVPINNIPLNTNFPFTAGASFRGGSNPTIAPTLVQATVDSNGLPRYWLVNANAPANSRIKSITVANNGNIQIRHHNDDLSDGNVLENTASGNTLTNGTFRPGAGTSNFTGASFVPGAIYHRSDLLTPHSVVNAGNTAGIVINSVGELVYSDGERWRRVSDGSDASIVSKVILTGTLPASIAANTFTNFGTLNTAGLPYLESVYIISVYFQFSDASNTNTGWWQFHGAGIISAIQWKAGGTQNAVTFKMEEHNGNDFICSARFSIANSNRIIQLAFDKALTFLGGASSYYRVTLKKVL
jgi:hypothetical protein